jgi:hypothetical protein
VNQGWIAAVHTGVIVPRTWILFGTVLAFAAMGAIAVAEIVAGEARPQTSVDGAALAWVRPGAVPDGWSTLQLPDSPARLSAPSGWRPFRSDPGTRTMVLRGSSGRIAGYLNATPQQGTETLANWSEFRVEHNEDEEELDVTLEAAASGLRFRSGRGSCVIDSYLTTTGNRYREVACIVAGHSAATVIVGAAPPALWDAEAPAIERAITSFTT